MKDQSKDMWSTSLINQNYYVLKSYFNCLKHKYYSQGKFHSLKQKNKT